VNAGLRKLGAAVDELVMKELVGFEGDSKSSGRSCQFCHL
jgi:hypothetical protein